MDYDNRPGWCDRQQRIRQLSEHEADNWLSAWTIGVLIASVLVGFTGGGLFFALLVFLIFNVVGVLVAGYRVNRTIKQENTCRS